MGPKFRPVIVIVWTHAQRHPAYDTSTVQRQHHLRWLYLVSTRLCMKRASAGVVQDRRRAVGDKHVRANQASDAIDSDLD